MSLLQQQQWDIGQRKDSRARRGRKYEKVGGVGVGWGRGTGKELDEVEVCKMGEPLQRA